MISEAALSTPMNGLRLSGPAVQPMLSVTLPEEVDGEAAEPAAEAETGCAYAPRCPLAIARCRTELPALRLLYGRQVACHRPGEAG